MRVDTMLTLRVVAMMVLTVTMACQPAVGAAQQPPPEVARSEVPLKRVTQEHLVFGPISDSASKVRLGKEALRRAGEVNELSVHRFTPDTEGTVISFLDPRYKFEGGGGGLVWVDVEGWALVIKTYQ